MVTVKIVKNPHIFTLAFGSCLRAEALPAEANLKKTEFFFPFLGNFYLLCILILRLLRGIYLNLYY